MGGQPEVNVNFLMFVPAIPKAPTLEAAINGANIAISLPTQAGFSYQVQYKNKLTDPFWIPFGSPLNGNGAVQTVFDSISGRERFYRVRIQ